MSLGRRQSEQDRRLRGGLQTGHPSTHTELGKKNNMQWGWDGFGGGWVCFESRLEREDSTGKMATCWTYGLTALYTRSLDSMHITDALHFGTGCTLLLYILSWRLLPRRPWPPVVLQPAREQHKELAVCFARETQTQPATIYLSAPSSNVLKT